MIFYTRRITQKGEASPALVPAEQSHPTYTLFARCDTPPNIPGVRHILQKNTYRNEPAYIGFTTMVWFEIAQLTVLQRDFSFCNTVFLKTKEKRDNEHIWILPRK